MKISENLYLLADIFATKTTLYLVGGYVRDSFLNVTPKDVDIASNLLCDEVIELLRGTNFKIISSIRSLGTLVISTNDESEIFEYTTFREDIYRLGSGLHRPKEVRFVKEIRKDALRRDFKINAIYYDIIKEEYVDPLGGIQDLVTSNITTTRQADIVFKEDPLRILRLIRLACEMKINISEDLLNIAKENSYLIYNVPFKKKKEEFIKMIFSDTKYRNRDKYAHYKAIKLLIKINAIDYFLKDFSKLENHNFKSGLNVLEHTLLSFKLSDKEVRFTTLIYNYGFLVSEESEKEWLILRKSALFVPKIYGPNFLDLDKKEIKDIKNLISIRDFNIDKTAKENAIKRFIAENGYVVEKFLKMRKADILARINSEDEESLDKEIYKDIKETYQYIKENKIPFRTKDLEVNAYDCYEIGISKNDTLNALQDLIKNILSTGKYTERENQLKFLKGYKKNKENSLCKKKRN